jgi:hypothetical protein
MIKVCFVAYNLEKKIDFFLSFWDGRSTYIYLILLVINFKNIWKMRNSARGELVKLTNKETFSCNLYIQCLEIETVENHFFNINF